MYHPDKVIPLAFSGNYLTGQIKCYRRRFQHGTVTTQLKEYHAMVNWSDSIASSINYIYDDDDLEASHQGVKVCKDCGSWNIANQANLGIQKVYTMEAMLAKTTGAKRPAGDE